MWLAFVSLLAWMLDRFHRLIKSMLTAAQGEDRTAFVELSKGLMTGFGPLFAFTKRYKITREENALRTALFVSACTHAYVHLHVTSHSSIAFQTQPMA